MRAGRNEKEMVILEESEIINHKFSFNVKLNADEVLSDEYMNESCIKIVIKENCGLSFMYFRLKLI